MSVLILDTETTGLSSHPEKGRPEVVELAFIQLPTTVPLCELRQHIDVLLEAEDIISATKSWSYTSKEYRFRPKGLIDPRASEIHGIFRKDVINCEPEERAITYIPDDTTYFLGHNITFDHRCLGKPDVKLICTLQILKTIKKHRPEIYTPSNKLDDVIRYLAPEHAGKLIKDTHAAYSDCIKVLLVINWLLGFFPAIKSFDDIYNLQQIPKVHK